MTTLAGARAELIAALEADGIRATDTPGGRDLPYVLVAGDGIELTHLVRGQGTATFRATCIAGAWDDSAAALALDELKLDVLGVLRALPGWRVNSVGRDGIRTYAGAELLTADCSASRMIDL